MYWRKWWRRRWHSRADADSDVFDLIVHELDDRVVMSLLSVKRSLAHGSVLSGTTTTHMTRSDKTSNGAVKVLLRIFQQMPQGQMSDELAAAVVKVLRETPTEHGTKLEALRTACLWTATPAQRAAIHAELRAAARRGEVPWLFG